MVYNGFLSPEQRASSCTECGTCEEKCPQDIQIREELKKVHLTYTGNKQKIESRNRSRLAEKPPFESMPTPAKITDLHLQLVANGPRKRLHG